MKQTDVQQTFFFLIWSRYENNVEIGIHFFYRMPIINKNQMLLIIISITIIVT